MAGFPFSLWDDPGKPVAPVGARATFQESAECLDGYDQWIADTSEPRRLDSEKATECFPTQTPAKRNALIACFNDYERNHPDHDGWPEDNMRGCVWDGLSAVPIRNVASLTLEEAIAVPSLPRAGERFVLTVPVTRTDSNAKPYQRGETDIANPRLEVGVTVDGQNVALESVEGCSECLPSADPESVYWFSDDTVRIEFIVPEATEGERLAIQIAADLGPSAGRTFGPTSDSGPLAVPDETPTATKLLMFTVAR
jgi:hypothetical protein